MFRFYIKWLKTASSITMLFGLFMAVLSIIPKNSPSFIDDQINKAFFSSGVEISQSVIKFQSWNFGVGASMLVAWGYLMLILTIKGLQNKEMWAWKSFTTALILWFIIDQPISTYFNVTFNVIFNFVFLLAFLMPTILIRKEMVRDTPKNKE